MIGSANHTINDVARLANVSKKTVSRVINKSPLLSDKTREHVEKIIAEIGYVPNPQARALALRRNFIIAAIHDNPNAQFLAKIQSGILDALKGTDFGLMVQPVERDSPRLIDNIREFIERHRPHGVVLLPPISEDEELPELCRKNGVRYTRLASIDLDKPENMVTSNDREATKEAVSHLLENGHCKIGLIEGTPGCASAIERRAGFEEAMQDAGLEIDPDMILPGNYTFESGKAAGADMLQKKDPPTAIFAANDQMAIGAMIAARQVGMDIPEQLSIVGFDDTQLSSQIWPPLTTVHWPIAEMAYTAARKLIRQDGDDPVDEIMLKSSLQKRGSVSTPRK